jgi:hypothetical protein
VSLSGSMSTAAHRRGPLRTVIACALLMGPPLMWAQPISFVRESLRFTLAGDCFTFSGTYYFDNPGLEPVERSIYYPFVLSGSTPDSMNIIEVRSGKAVTAVPGRSGVTFVATILPRSTRSYRISFVQRARKQSLEYILTTTAAWERPLDRATFIVRVPANIVLKSLSLKPSTISSVEGVTTYIIEREHFMPGENLILRWGRKRP